MEKGKKPTVWETAQARGISRRDFIRECTIMAAMPGLPATGIGQIVKALETKPRLPVVWFHFQECTCGPASPRIFPGRSRLMTSAWGI